MRSHRFLGSQSLLLRRPPGCGRVPQRIPLEQYGSAAPLLIDAGHFATERPWLTMAADLLVSDLASQGSTVEQVVLSAITDPWSAQATRRGQE